MSNLPKPSQRTLDAFRYWFNEPHAILGGQFKYFLDTEDDLVALTAQQDVDPASYFLRQFWPARSVSSGVRLTRSKKDGYLMSGN
jgi:hypothetical protein